MDSARVFVDVSGLPAPEPLSVSMDAAAALQPGQYLHIHHWREPLLLYERLARKSFGYETRMNNDDFEIFVWRRDDSVATEAARNAAAGFAPLRE